MSWLDGVRHRVRTVLRPGAYEAELREEMRFHRELDAQQQGDAVRARRRFGNELWYREEARRMTWLAALDTVRQDVAHAWRSMVRAPGLTAMVVVTLALGIGVNGAMFTLLDRLYLRPPGGLTEAGTLRRVWVQHFNTADGVPFVAQMMNYPMYGVIAEAWGAPETLAVYTSFSEQRLSREPGAARARQVYASANLFDVLGVRPALGRLYTAEEDRLGAGADVAVLGDAFWRRHLGGDPGALGQTLTLGARSYTVIGVLPPSFTGLELQPADVWLPLGAMPTPSYIRDVPWWESVNMFTLRAVVRLREGMTTTPFERQSTARIRAFNRERFPNRPDTLMNVYAGSIIEARGPARQTPEQQISVRLGGVSVIVLLIACANVINLLLARAVQRRRENAVRLALGISRWRMMRLVTAETLLLAALAGAGALLAASWGGSVLRSLLLPGIEWLEPVLDLRVALFTMAVALAAGVVAGVVPAVQSGRTDLTHSLKAGSREGVRQRSRLRSGLVVVQAALSVVLLIGALLFVRSLRNVQDLDIGYDASRLFFGSVEFAVGEAPPGPILAATLRDVAQRLEQRPGVDAVARASLEPMRGFSFVNFYTGADSLMSFAPAMPTMTAVSPSFFRTVGLGIVRGRGFQGADEAGGAPEVVVNEAMARLVWPGAEPLGQCMHFNERTAPCYRVVGVVANARRDRVIEDAPAPQYYLPLGSTPAANLHGTTLMVRAMPRAAAAAATELRTELRRAFPAGLASTTAMLEHLEPQYRPWRLGATLFSAFGLLALLVALIGIYTTVSYGVTQRTHEFGVRMALGARVADVVRLVVGEGLRTVALGVVLGIALALAAGRLIAALLYGVEPGDAGILASVGAGLLAVAALAALVPAWRAGRTDPLATLRTE
jgi:putative ABC transport system permease protein